jgi:hypothetical protein
MEDELQARLDELNGEGLEVPTDASPIDFLCAIFRNPRQPMHRRLKAAIEAAPFCHPQLKATAVILGSDFATKLENAMKRSDAAKLIEVQPSLSDQQD